MNADEVSEFNESSRKRPRGNVQVPTQNNNTNPDWNTSTSITDTDMNIIALSSPTEPSINTPRNNICDSSPPNESNDANVKMRESEPPTNRLKEHQVKIKKLKLEAIFHPKFDNEQQNDLQIRNTMISRISSNQGYIEVTLKHSGSLMLWSGQQRFYSKNSTQNVVTAVGEILLRQHFARAWNTDVPNNDTATVTDTNIDTAQQNFKECSDYIEKHRLTLSFEVVPSILGHHGDLPKRDYMILIAVADRKREKFYSTAELTAFAQQFRLPHNDAWLFHTTDGVRNLFHLYDSMRETGVASTVIRALDKAADGGVVKSMYPHSIFQGEILEGIVIRYVSYDAPGQSDDGTNIGVIHRVKYLGRMKELCVQSEKVLEAVPPQKELDYSQDEDSTTGLLNINIRNLEEEQDLEDKLSQVLDAFHGSNGRHTVRLNARDTGIDLEQVSNDILSSPAADAESKRIAQLIQTVVGLKVHISYKIFEEKTLSQQNNEKKRLICIVHVHHDQTFQKYSKATQNTGAMGLFRGFSLELIPEDAVEEEVCTEGDKSLNNALESFHLKSEHSAEENGLMLKMKFLPYMVRTFICRNGLSIMEQSRDAFEDYALNQFTRWGMSETVLNKWMPFFRGWAMYCQSPTSVNSDRRKLPPLSSKLYLHHYNAFSKLFEDGQFQVAKSNKRSFRGTIVLVGLEQKTLAPLAKMLMGKLSCSKIINNSNILSPTDMVRSIQRNGGGIVCTSEIKDGMKAIRNLAKRFESALYIVMVGCSERELESSFAELHTNTNESRKITGMVKGWMKCKCNSLLCLPKTALLQTPTTMLEGDNVNGLINTLQESSDSFQTDERPGVVVFFPAIPGSGKSSLCQGLTPGMLGMTGKRKLLVEEGDKVRGKYYLTVTQKALDNPASVVIADKNVPPASWPLISDLCSQSQSVAVAIFPEGMENTHIGEGPMRFVYPFSLEYLAVCISRVLDRAPNSHNGKLDSATDLASMIVVKFFCFYRHKTYEALEKELHCLGKGCNNIIRIPFFSGKEAHFPDDLCQALNDAIIMQTNDDLKLEKTSDKDASTMEETLRAAIKKHAPFLGNLTANLDVSRKIFQSQLCDIIQSLGEKFTARSVTHAMVSNDDECLVKPIKIVSLDVPSEAVHSALQEVAKDFEDVKEYLANRDQDKCNDEDNIKLCRFITSTHCTFAHCSKTSQKKMHKRFSHLIGSEVEISVTALLYSDKIAALQIAVPSTSAIIPAPQNQFAHITVWCAGQTEAHTSNSLPQSVESSEATMVKFKNPISIKGIFTFWHKK